MMCNCQVYFQMVWIYCVATPVFIFLKTLQFIRRRRGTLPKNIQGAGPIVWGLRFGLIHDIKGSWEKINRTVDRKWSKIIHMGN